MANEHIDYNEQMLNYCPEVFKVIREFQTLIATQSLQIGEIHEQLAKVLENAYITDGDESVIATWEKVLGITPLPQGDDDLETWLSDRRETILARLYGNQKLNTKSIAEIVSIFTGGSATSYFKDGVIYVGITPPNKNKSFKLENVIQELRKKIPAHLNLEVGINYYTWGEVFSKNATWGDVNNNHTNWDDVLYHP